jgi:hypothetical protein
MVNNKRNILLLLLAVLTIISSAACGMKPEEASAPTFENTYSEALGAYRDLLLNKTPDRIYDIHNVPQEFAIVDMDDDGTPELLMKGFDFDVMTYENGYIIGWGGAPGAGELLNNRAVFTESWRWDGFMYTEFDKTGHTSYFRHFLNRSGEWHYSEKVMPIGSDTPENEVTEEEYNRLFAPYREFMESGADMIPWTDYDEWIKAHPDEYIPVRVTEALGHRQ